MTTDPTLKLLSRMVGDWTTEATHPAMPGVVVHGTANIEWLEGERFLIVRARTDHPQFPDSIAIIGDTEHDRAETSTGAAPASKGEPHLSLHYFDSRGVFRRYDASIDEAAVRWWRDDPGFPQRFTGTFADGGATIVGLSQLRENGGPWKDDLAITYRRQR
jgi:hypothetical protein